MRIERMKMKIDWWIAQRLSGRILLYAVVRAFAYFGDAGNHNYKEVWDRVVKENNLKEVDL